MVTETKANKKKRKKKKNPQLSETKPKAPTTYQFLCAKKPNTFNKKFFQNQNKYAFIDFEFQSPTQKGEPASLISVGVVITDKDFKEIDNFYSLIKPIHPVTPFVEEYTGLTNELLATEQEFPEILPKIKAILDKHSIKTVYNYGRDDKKMVRSCSKHYQVDYLFEKYSLKDVQLYFKDIKILNSPLFAGSPSLKFLSELISLNTLEMPNFQEHNALDDARRLAYVAEGSQYYLQFNQIAYEILNRLIKRKKTINNIDYNYKNKSLDFKLNLPNIENEETLVRVKFETESQNYLYTTNNNNVKIPKDVLLLIIRLVYLQETCFSFLRALFETDILNDVTISELYDLYIYAYCEEERMIGVNGEELKRRLNNARNNPEINQNYDDERFISNLALELYDDFLGDCYFF